MNDTTASAFGSLINIFVDPKKAFSDVRGHASWLWYPLLIAVLSTVVMFVWYYSTADWDVLKQQSMDYLVAHNYDKDTINRAMAGMTRRGLIMQTCIGISVFLAIIYLVQALYLFLVSKIGGYEAQGYGEWFSFTSWVYLPMVIGNIAFAVTYLISGAHTSTYALDVTSLNTLIFKTAPDSPWFGLLSNLHLGLFWTFFLMIFGFAQWTRQSLGKSALITLAPHALIYIVWILIDLK